MPWFGENGNIGSDYNNRSKTLVVLMRQGRAERKRAYIINPRSHKLVCTSRLRKRDVHSKAKVGKIIMRHVKK